MPVELIVLKSREIRPGAGLEGEFRVWQEARPVLTRAQEDRQLDKKTADFAGLTN